MKIDVSVDLDDLWDDCGGSYSQIIKEELQHEFKLAIRREMKKNQEFEQKVKAMVTEVSRRMESELLQILGVQDEK